MKTYKDYVSYMQYPEGCIAERVVIEEALAFCYDFLTDVERVGLPKPYDIAKMEGKGVKGYNRTPLKSEEWRQAHTYVLHNDVEIESFIDEHKTYLKDKPPSKSEMWLETEHTKVSMFGLLKRLNLCGTMIQIQFHKD